MIFVNYKYKWLPYAYWVSVPRELANTLRWELQSKLDIEYARLDNEGYRK